MLPNDSELIPMLRQRVFSALLGDVLDKMGFLHQFLPPEVRPLRDDMIVAGRAMPVLEVTLPEAADPLRKPFGLMLEALDDLKPLEVYVAAAGMPPYALWGELMSTRAHQLGAAGAVMDGYSRDTAGILEVGMPSSPPVATPRIKAPAARSPTSGFPCNLAGSALPPAI